MQQHHLQIQPRLTTHSTGAATALLSSPNSIAARLIRALGAFWQQYGQFNPMLKHPGYK